jgi:hypothetical protein
MGKIKRTAIPYAGYEYQTLFGVRKLLEWSKNPGIYTQVAFEADTSNEDIPTAVDDIVCKRFDNTYEYYQVKFTADELKHELSWDWLFYKTKKGRSLVKKLFDGLHRVDLNKIHSAELVTNRIPSEDVSSSLTKDYLNFSKLSEEIKSKFIVELETEANVIFLITHLKFSHSRKDILKLRVELLSEAFKLGASEFIHHLVDEARIWATHKDNPNDEGWIYLSDVKRILTIARPKPLPQSFSIPDNYAPPCEKFHSNLLSNILEKHESIFVITGPPGRGKSTYLSYLTKKLDESKVPYIRHHYFLSIEDKTGDRFGHFTVQNDLKHQLETFHGVGGDSLTEVMQACAKRYASEDKPLVVLIDGLDHVWRDNNEDINPLDTLFNELLPPINNVIYIIGTQPVEDRKLPKKLLQLKRRDSWLTLPPLTGNSILKLIRAHAEEGRLQLHCSEGRESDCLSESAEALFELTLGHPLSIIYVIEQISASKIPISAYEIGKLPKIFGEHIYDYYSELWRVISYPQKYALHIICEFNFGWEKVHLNNLVLNGEPDDYVSGIQHLLFRSRTGYKSFHESLVAFVKGLPEHYQVIDRYMPAISDWIGTHASDYIRNIWMIKCNLQTEKYDEIKAVLNRDWVVHRLSEGYFPRELEGILETASLHYIKQGYLAESHSFRTIKTRVANASHNIHELVRLVELTLKRAPSSIIDEYLATVEQFTPDELAQLSICLHYRDNRIDSESLNELAKDSYNASYLLRTRQNDSTHEVSEIFRSEILLDHDISDNILKFGETYYSGVIQACLESANLEALIKYHNVFDSVVSQANAEVSCYRLAISEGVDSKFVLDDNSLNKSAFIKVARKLNASIFESDIIVNIPKDRAIIKSNSSSYADEFFHTLNTLLEVKGDCSWLPCNLSLEPNYSHKEGGSTKVCDAILEAASFIRQCLSDNYRCSFTEILASIYKSDLDHDNHWEQQSVNNFLHEFTVVALDCHFLFRNDFLTQEEIKYLVDSDLYNKIRFFHWYAKLKLSLLTPEAVQFLLNSIIEDLGEFDIQERAHLFIAAGEIALTHGKEQDADSYIKKAWDITIGYGSYKDSTINDVISSTMYLSEIDSEGAIEILRGLEPFISCFDSLTTEGSVPNDQINEILAKFSVTTLASKYESELVFGEARAADNTLSNLLEFGDLSSPLIGNLCRTGLLSDNLRSLEIRGNKGDKKAQLFLEIALKHNGSNCVVEKEERYSSSSTEKEKLEAEDFARFPPDKFLDFVKAYQKRNLYEEHYVAWFDFWIYQGKQKELLAHLVPLALESNKYAMRYLLDCLFELSVKFRGIKKSFDLVVAAHNGKKGWNTYFETETAYSRLNKVAEIYPERINQFIANTTFNIKGEGLSLPYHRYTYLLCQLDRKKEAKEFASSLARQVIDETSVLGAQSSNWNWDEREDNDALLDILISRLNIPIASVKWWVAQQLAEILIEPQFSERLETKLLMRLSNAEIELQCIEILSIFYFASCLGYVPHEDISKLINARSLCSDLIIKRLGLCKEDSRAVFDTSVFIPFQNKAMRNAFDTANGRDFPSIYFSSLEELQNAARMPFPVLLAEVMRSEWCKMQFDAQNYDSDLSYYINSDGHSRGGTALVYPCSGLRARSAYLRALEFTAVNFGMPKAIHELKANLAFPFDPSLFFLRPESIFNVNKYEWSSEPPKIFESIQLLIFDTVSEFQELGAISFSVNVDDLCFIEVEVIKASCDSVVNLAKREEPWLWRYQEQSIANEKIIVNASKRSETIPLLAAKSYPYQHYGHWHSEVDSRGIYCPVLWNENDKLVMRYTDNCIEFICKESKVAEFRYANNNWQPSYNKAGNSNTISMLMLEKEHKNIWTEQIECESFRCQIRVFKKKESYSDFEMEDYEQYLPEMPD